MKRLLLTGAVFLCSILSTFAQYSGSGNGTEDDPYLIFNETQLSQMANFLNQDGVVFKLMKDLDLTDWIAENNPKQGWNPIGVESSPFKGIFYGNNHKITGFTVNRSSQSHVGFFGNANGATVKDLTLEGTTVTGAAHTGFLLGSSTNCTISNVTLNGTDVKGTSEVGFLSGTSTSSTFSTISITGTKAKSTQITGFAVGYAINCGFSDVQLKGSVESDTLSTGGCIGVADGCTINNYTAETPVKGKAQVGGLIGYCASATTITNVKVKGDINGTSNIGGLIGYIRDGKDSLANCSYTGDISGSDNVSGIAGYLNAGSSVFFTYCHSKGKITAAGDYVGGIVANSRGACISGMESCSHFGDIRGCNYIGGLLGGLENVTDIPKLHVYTIWSGRSNESPTGSKYFELIESVIEGDGLEKNFSINNCTVSGNISGRDFVGGLIGFEIPAYGYSPVENKYTYAFDRTISWGYQYRYLFKDDKYSGTYGVVYYYTTDKNGGYLKQHEKNHDEFNFSYNNYQRSKTDLYLTNSFYSGKVKGEKNVGGIAGYKSGGAVNNNYSYAAIEGESNVGGIIGGSTGERNGTATNTISIKSNVSNDALISATKENVGRVYGSVEEDCANIGAIGSKESNRALATSKVVLSGVVQEVEDDLQNGTSIGISALKLKANYVAWGWDFDTNWNILETECFPYKKYQAAPPVITSDLVSQATSISGNSLNGGTVYLFYKDRAPVSTECSGNNWSFATEALQSGAQVQLYADVDSLIPSYFTAATVKYPGSGTEEDPYRIYTAEDLQGASNRGYYKLMNDIDLTQWINENSPEKGWVAIGRNSGEATYIDGDGHKVTGLWINDPEEDFNGLFSNFSAGQLKNLNVEVAEGKSVIGGDYTGVLIGRNANGKIVNCTVKGDVKGARHVGGIAGYTENTRLTSLTYEGTVTTSSDSAYAGGVNGLSKNSIYTNCNTTATIKTTGDSTYVGGLAGFAGEGSITKSQAHGAITATGKDNMAGGIAGKASATISQTYAAGSVSSTGEGTESYTGGLVGYATDSITNCYATADVTGGYFTAGLVGYTFSVIDKCYAKGGITGVTYGGGVVGELDGANAKLTNSVAANSTLTLTAKSAWGSRVIGGYKNGANDPDENNYALNTMQVSLNGVPQKKTDDIVEGIVKTADELKTQATYTGIGWNFTKIWSLADSDALPHLLAFDKLQFTLGDVNNDKQVNVIDVIDIARYVAGTPADNFQELAADVNDDGNINIADAVALVNTIAGDVSAAAKPNAFDGETTADALTLVKDGESLHMNLTNALPYTAFQFDLNTTENVVTALLDANRSNGHQLLCNKIAEGKYRVVALSLSNAPFVGNDGTLLNITLDGEPASASISNIHFITPDAVDHIFGTVQTTDATGISEIDADNGESGSWYTLQGVKTSKGQKGVYIHNGKKVIVK